MALPNRANSCGKLSWGVLIGVLVYSIVVLIDGGVTTHGKVLSTLMYVFSYTESALILPLFYQQFVRLREISHRLAGEPGTASAAVET